MSDSAYRFPSGFPGRIAITGLLLIAACIGIASIGDLRSGLFDPNEILPDPLSVWVALPDALLLFWVPFVAAFIVYAVAVARQVGSDTPPDRRLLWFILAVAVFCRVILQFSPPTLSDDIHRYLWDAKMQFQGVNPYVYAPESEEIAHLRDEFHLGINNKDVPTVYPPLMQAAFAVAAYLWYSPASMKLLFTLCDVGVIVLTILMLRRRSLPEERVLIYAWNPLVLVEIAGSGHNDSLPVVLMLAALLAIDGHRPTRAVAWLSLSMLAKWFTVMLVPAFYRRIRRIRPFWLLPVLLLAFYLPYMDAGPRLFSGLLVYGDKWRFNDSVFSIFFFLTDSLNVSKVIVAALFAGLVAFCAFRITDPFRSAFILLGGYLLLTPTVQPWYLVWVIPFLCLYPNPAWVLLSGLAALSYHVAIGFVLTETWEEEIWVRFVQYVPFYGLLIAHSLRNGTWRNLFKPASRTH
ncbi:MAG: hypothetical protein OXG98_01540 [Gemmatimonadetes bacterium]|nr:hypothetical protein [Gemmatimonadota bacterium]